MPILSGKWQKLIDSAEYKGVFFAFSYINIDDNQEKRRPEGRPHAANREVSRRYHEGITKVPGSAYRHAIELP